MTDREIDAAEDENNLVDAEKHAKTVQVVPVGTTKDVMMIAEHATCALVHTTHIMRHPITRALEDMAMDNPQILLGLEV